jgi:hypothetical protein
MISAGGAGGVELGGIVRLLSWTRPCGAAWRRVDEGRQYLAKLREIKQAIIHDTSQRGWQ